eukprot:m.306733 g.306733  ORF g.306733 m.306733 type:complete len:540 (+) comp41543_c0_seq1:225-1844(+)
MPEIADLIARLESASRRVAELNHQLDSQSRQAAEDVASAISQQIDSLRQREKQLHGQITAFHEAKCEHLRAEERAISTAISHLTHAATQTNGNPTQMAAHLEGVITSVIDALQKSDVDVSFSVNDDTLQKAVATFGTLPDPVKADDGDLTSLVDMVTTGGSGAALWLYCGEPERDAADAVRDGFRKLHEGNDSMEWLHPSSQADLHFTSFQSYSLKGALEKQSKARDQLATWLVSVESEPLEPSSLARAVRCHAGSEMEEWLVTATECEVSVETSVLAGALTAALTGQYGSDDLSAWMNSEESAECFSSEPSPDEEEGYERWLSSVSGDSPVESLSVALKRLSTHEDDATSWLPSRDEGEESTEPTSLGQEYEIDLTTWLAPNVEPPKTTESKLSAAKFLMKGLEKLKKGHSLQNWLHRKKRQFSFSDESERESGYGTLITALKRYYQDDDDPTKWLHTSESQESGAFEVESSSGENDYSCWLAKDSGGSYSSSFKFFGFGGDGETMEIASEADSQDFEILDQFSSRGTVSSLDEDWIH